MATHQPSFPLNNPTSAQLPAPPFNPFSHQTEQILLEVEQGNQQSLPYLLARTAKAAYRQQIPESLRILKALCHSLVSPKVIWKTRNRLLLNNIQHYRSLTYCAKKYYEINRYAPWFWTTPAEHSLACILTDMDIWEYCVTSSPPNANLASALQGEADRPAVLNALIHRLFTADHSSVQYPLAVNLLHKYSQSLLHKAALRKAFNHTINLNRLMLVIHNSSHDNGERQRLLVATLNLLSESSLFERVDELATFDGDTVSATLHNLAAAPDDWYRGFFNGSPLRQHQQEQNLAAIRQHIRCVALKTECMTAMRRSMTHQNDILIPSTGAQHEHSIPRLYR